MSPMWEFGAYYRCEFDQLLEGDMWATPMDLGVSVAKGTIYYCKGIVTKTEKYYGLDCEPIFEEQRFLRLVCFDPRCPDNTKFLNYDLKWPDHMRPPSGYWKKVTSPLLMLALVSAGLAPDPELD